MKIYKMSKLHDANKNYEAEYELYTQCMHCKKYKTENQIFKHLIEMNEDEIQTVRMIEDNWGDLSKNFRVSHGICNDCINQHYNF
jgi:hypothetical protein